MAAAAISRVKLDTSIPTHLARQRGPGSSRRRLCRLRALGEQGLEVELAEQRIGPGLAGAAVRQLSPFDRAGGQRDELAERLGDLGGGGDLGEGLAELGRLRRRLGIGGDADVDLALDRSLEILAAD